MKQKRRRKTKKLISKLLIAIVTLFVLSIVLLMFSEKVNKIAIIDNVKNQVKFMAEQIQSMASTLVLNTKVNLSAANGKGGVDLDWSTYDSERKNI